MPRISSEMQQCIDTCLQCYETCLGTAMNHCLEQGGSHVEPGHFRLMMACAEACRASADLMLIQVPQHRLQCGVCAEICVACADSCRSMSGMEACETQCRKCADVCRQMAA